MTTSVQLLIESINNINDTIYIPVTHVNLKSSIRLSDALMKKSLTPKNVVKWQYQISVCIAKAYKDFVTHKDVRGCPMYVDPQSILLDSNDDIVCHTVTDRRQKADQTTDAKYVDCILRIHSTMFSFISKSNTNRKYFKELNMLRTLGTFYYAAVASTAFNTSIYNTFNSVKVLYEMSELNTLRALLNNN